MLHTSQWNTRYWQIVLSKYYHDSPNPNLLTYRNLLNRLIAHHIEVLRRGHYSPPLPKIICPQVQISLLQNLLILLCCILCWKVLPFANVFFCDYLLKSTIHFVLWPLESKSSSLCHPVVATLMRDQHHAQVPSWV